jgi:hypothetical protein
LAHMPIPHVRCKTKRGVQWGLVDKPSPAFELRNSGVPAVVRSFQLPRSTLRRQLSPRLRWSSRSPSTTGILRLQTPSPGSPLPIIAAYTYLKQHWQPSQVFMAGYRITPVLVFWTLRELNWVKFTFETGFELPSSWINLPCYGLNQIRNILDFMRWPHIGLVAQDLNDIQRPKSFQKSS